MTEDTSKRPPARTLVVTSPTLSRVDVGLVVSSVARAVWSEIEARAGLVIELDAWGPAIGDEALLEQLLQSMVREVLLTIPEGTPLEHVLAINAHAFPDETLAIDVRHQRRAGPSPRTATRADAPYLAAWDRVAMQCTGRVDQVDDPASECCYRITLRLAV